ncbi:MAG: D-glycerate dehydrogenase [Caldilineales bacterium]|nr:D-glycerate dehydrogenase [Caldilineales bacterium]
MKPKVYVTRRLPKVAWDELIEACDAELWDEEFPPPHEELLARVADKEGLLCLLTDRIDADLMDSAPNLKVISQCAVGFDNIDVAAATARGVPVGHTPGVLTDATADFAWALLMSAARRVPEAVDYVRAGKWNTWGLTVLLGQRVYGMTLGVVGMGRIGQAVAERARGFNMRILYYDAFRQPEAEERLGVEYRSLEEVLAGSDFVTLHVNLTDETRHMINARTLAMMKPTAIVINTSRGPVIDMDALYDALKAGVIVYAALDVTDPEPLPADHKLLTLSNCIINPHIASGTIATRTLMAQMAVRNLIAGLRGEALPNQVNSL